MLESYCTISGLPLTGDEVLIPLGPNPAFYRDSGPGRFRQNSPLIPALFPIHLRDEKPVDDDHTRFLESKAGRPIAHIVQEIRDGYRAPIPEMTLLANGCRRVPWNGVMGVAAIRRDVWDFMLPLQMDDARQYVDSCYNRWIDDAEHWIKSDEQERGYPDDFAHPIQSTDAETARAQIHAWVHNRLAKGKKKVKVPPRGPADGHSAVFCTAAGVEHSRRHGMQFHIVKSKTDGVIHTRYAACDCLPGNIPDGTVPTEFDVDKADRRQLAHYGWIPPAPRTSNPYDRRPMGDFAIPEFGMFYRAEFLKTMADPMTNMVSLVWGLARMGKDIVPVSEGMQHSPTIQAAYHAHIAKLAEKV